MLWFSRAVDGEDLNIATAVPGPLVAVLPEWCGIKPRNGENDVVTELLEMLVGQAVPVTGQIRRTVHSFCKDVGGGGQHRMQPLETGRREELRSMENMIKLADRKSTRLNSSH